MDLKIRVIYNIKRHMQHKCYTEHDQVSAMLKVNFCVVCGTRIEYKLICRRDYEDRPREYRFWNGQCLEY